MKSKPYKMTPEHTKKYFLWCAIMMIPMVTICELVQASMGEALILGLVESFAIYTFTKPPQKEESEP